MKIGILTFHCAINFGAVLQAYGLQEYLRSQGHEVYVLDYRPKYLLSPYKLFKWKWDSSLSLIDNLKYFIRDCMTFPIRRKRRVVFREFLKGNISLCRFNPNEDTSFDAYVLGSDQIWNPQITKGFDDVYFGIFPAAKDKKVVSYAASVGATQNIIPVMGELCSKVENRFVGIREQSLIECFEKYGLISPELTLDPVLLVGKKVFDKFVNPVEKEIPYLLCFQITYDENVVFVAKTIAKEKGLDIIQVVSSSESLNNKSLRLTESPEHFVSLLAGAAYVVTSSFHGTAFSILYEKDFNIVSIDSALSERMQNLLYILHLEDRLVVNSTNIKTTKIDFHFVNESLNKLRESSQNFLTNALS